MRVYVEGIGVVGPGLQGWPASRAVLSGSQPYVSSPTSVPAVDLLPAAERRRTGVPVKLALAVAQEAFAHARRDPAATATAFTSSSGDGDNVHHILEILASPSRELSPTRFHNSVHNAAAGYWTIATGCHAASTAISAQRASFGAGLLEAACQVLTEQRPVLLVCSDTAASGPLTAITGCHVPFGCALVLTPAADAHTVARLDLNLHPGSITATPSSASIPADWAGRNASAPALPLLAMLAAQGAGNGSCRLRVADALGMDVLMEASA